MSSSEPPIFYFDLGSPYAWLAAERIHQVLPVTPVWQPILLGGIWQQTGGQSWAMTERRDEGMREIARRAEEARSAAGRHPPAGAGRSLCGRAPRVRHPRERAYFSKGAHAARALCAPRGSTILPLRKRRGRPRADTGCAEGAVLDW